MCSKGDFVMMKFSNWRKFGIYSLLSLLALITVANIGLTLWLLARLHFNMSGAGHLELMDGGIRVTGTSYILGKLTSSEIRSGPSDLTLLSNKQVKLASNDSKFVLKHNAELLTSELKVLDGGGEELLVVKEGEVRLGMGKLVTSNKEGVVMAGALQTPLVHSTVSNSLKLESPTRDLTISGPDGVELSSQGDIQIKAWKNIRLKTDEEVVVKGAPVLIPGLPVIDTNIAINNYSKSIQDTKDISIYQVCSCSNGRLFLAPAKKDVSCNLKNSICDDGI